MQTIGFGGEKHERVAISILGYERPASGEYWDDNWLSVEVSIAVGAFAGKYQASFQAAELEGFYGQLVKLLETLKGSAEFRTLEGQLSLTLAGDGLGHIQLEGEGSDQSGVGGRLTFSLPLDQSQLQSSVRSLGAAMAAYPVRT